MKSFIEKIYFHRSKEDNWDLCGKAKELGFKNSSDLKYTGYEISMDVEFFEDGRRKVLSIDGINVSDKDIMV